ncbi:MAG: MATE family efflux transporter [Ruminococcus sp.]
MAKDKSISQYDKMTKTPVHRLIISLSIPTIISMLITNVYNLADTAFVGQLSTSASGAVGVVFGFMAILQAIGFMFGNGAGSIISRLLGTREYASANKFASTGFFFSLAVGGIIGVLGFIFIDPLVAVLGSTPTITPYAKSYISFILIASPFMTASFLMNNILRYEGKAMLGMIGLMAGSILNIAGDPIFMFCFDMGIDGAGLSTCVSQVISFFILLSMFLFGKTQCRFSFSNISFHIRDITNIITTGLPSLLRQGLNSLSTVLLNLQCSFYGDEAVAGMSIVTRIIFFAFSIALGVGQGFQPVCGFNLGAGKYSRIRKGYKCTLGLAQGIIIVMTTLLILFSTDLMGIFRNDPKVIEIGTTALIYQAISILFLPFCMVTEMSYQSSGKRLGASMLSSLRSGLLFIPCLLIMSFTLGLTGIQFAQPVSNAISFIPSIFFAIHYFKNLPKADKEN